MTAPARAASGRRFWVRIEPYAYLSPALITISLLAVVPMVWTIWVGFTNYSLTNMRPGTVRFIGLANFREMFTGPLGEAMRLVIGWNIVYAFLATLSSYALGLFVAVLLNNRHLRETALYRGLLILPWALPGTIAILAWQGLLQESYGMINQTLLSIGLAPVPWLSEPLQARIAVLGVNLWFGFPYFMSLCLGALSAVPHDLYEAADIDGAGRWAKFRTVTLPALAKITFPLLVTSFSFNFTNFGISYLITHGDPKMHDIASSANPGYTDVLISIIYKLTHDKFRYGLAGAMVLVLWVIIGLLTVVNMKLTGQFEEVD